MKKVVFAAVAVLALTLTTGFTCSKKAPEQAAAPAVAAPAEQAQMAAPAVSTDPTSGTPTAAPAAPAPTENK